MNQTPYSRLFVASAANRKADINDLNTSDIANDLDISVQLLSNWRRRGIPKSKLSEIAKKIGVSEYWLENGYEKRERTLEEFSAVIDEISNLPDEQSNNLIDKFRENITPIFDRLTSSKETRQKSMNDLHKDLKSRVKGLGLEIFPTPQIYGLNIKQWAKLSFLVVSTNGETVFLSVIPKGVIPARPEDSHEFIHVHEGRLGDIESKLSKRFSIPRANLQLSESEKLIKEIQDRELRKSEIDFVRNIIRDDTLQSLNLKKLTEIITLLKEIK